MGKPLVSKVSGFAVNLKTILQGDNGIASGLWPPTCQVCGLECGPALDCCGPCRERLPRIGATCARCALPLPRPAQACGACIRKSPAFVRAFAGFAYENPVAGMVQRFKFHRDLAAGRALAGLLARELARQQAPRPDLMVPVPLNWRRRWRRGFNQAERLCRDLSEHFSGLPWYPALKRLRPTAAQSDLPAARRASNVRGAFRLHHLPAGCRHVALVDDVMTTGATLNECARILTRAGVDRVDVWIIARA